MREVHPMDIIGVKLPVGIENFEEIRTEGFYYVGLKDVDGDDFTSAYSMVCSAVGSEALRFQFLLESDRLSETEKEMYRQLEIRKIFTGQIMKLFQENVQRDGEAINTFCEALQSGDAFAVETKFTEYLKKTISIRDTFVKKQTKENFYHGILLGILGFKVSWGVSSNQEAGDGYSDIQVETDDGTGIIIEVKYAHDADLDAQCKKALEQIDTMGYTEQFYDEGVQTILKYGIACYKKRCQVMVVKERIQIQRGTQ